MFSVIDRYLLREVIQSWLAVTLVLWLILVSGRLSKYLAQAASGELPGELVLGLLGLKSVAFLVFIMPLAMFLAVLLGLGRLYRDSEMYALGACGVGALQIYRPLMILAAVLSLVLGWAALVLVPETAAKGYALRAVAQETADFSTLGPGRFKEVRDGELVFYAEQVSRDRRFMERVFVHAEEGGEERVLSAARAYQRVDPATGDRFLVLVDGYRYEGSPGSADYRALHYRQHGVLLEAGPGSPRRKEDAIPTRELLGAEEPALIAELQWRLSVPVSILALVLFAVPLCQSTPRQGRYLRLTLGVLVFVVYYNLLSTARILVEQEVLTPLPGVWWVHLLPPAGALLLFYGGRVRGLWRRRP